MILISTGPAHDQACCRPVAAVCTMASMRIVTHCDAGWAWAWAGGICCCTPRTARWASPELSPAPPSVDPPTAERLRSRGSEHRTLEPAVPKANPKARSDSWRCRGGKAAGREQSQIPAGHGLEPQVRHRSKKAPSYPPPPPPPCSACSSKTTVRTGVLRAAGLPPVCNGNGS